jgi:hypothetical protein
MRKNHILILVALSLILLVISPVFASRVEFDSLGKCDITGLIKNVNFEEAYEDSCVKDDSCPVGAFATERSARYILSIYIDTLSCIPGEADNPSTYESQFKLDDENSISLNLMDVNEGDKFEPGDKINGVVKFQNYAHTFVSYELEKSDAKVTEDKNEDDLNNNIDDKEQTSNTIPNIAFFAGIIVVLIVLWLFLIKRR